MADPQGDDLKDFKPWTDRLFERHPWLAVFGFASAALDLAYLAILVAAFGATGIAFWLFGGAPP